MEDCAAIAETHFTNLLIVVVVAFAAPVTLGPAPPKLVPTRIALHRLAAHVVSPARRKANGKIGLRYTRDQRETALAFFRARLRALVG